MNPRPAKQAPIRILFVCHGNICRSAIAEYLMKDMIGKRGLRECFYVESAATSTEELGCPVYPPARRVLNAHGIDCRGHAARQIVRGDYSRFDLLIGMDERNIWNMKRAFGGDPEGKIHLLSEYAHFSGEVEDPWYTGRFEKVYDQIQDGLEGILASFDHN